MNANHPARPPRGAQFTDGISHFLKLPLAGPRAVVGMLLACIICLGLTGCFGFLKPAKATAQHFVLTSVPVAEAAKAAVGGMPVGVGPVKIPDYLLDSSFAVRIGTNQIEYMAMVLWAERLNTGLQRVLAGNLATLLPTDQVRLSTWRSEDVAAEVYVTIERFDVDTSGRAVLVAWWRILSPGGEKTLKAGDCRLTREGPSPDANPAGAIATLSDLTTDLSRQIVQALKETPLAARPSRGTQ